MPKMSKNRENTVKDIEKSSNILKTKKKTSTISKNLEKTVNNVEKHGEKCKKYGKTAKMSQTPKK